MRKYALGGIDSLNFKECLEAGLTRYIVMSGAMRCEDELRFVKNFLLNINYIIFKVILAFC